MATETKIKKKIFVKIVSPKDFNEQIIGETPVADARTLIGKNMRMNLMGITNDPRDQNIEVKFHISTLKGDSVGTEIIGYKILPAFIRKLVRKEKRRVDDCFVLKTADNKDVEIKPFLLTIHVTSQSVLASLRKKIHELLKNEVSKLSFSALIMEVLSRKIQDKLRKDLAKIYPLKCCEIRSIEIVTEKKKPGEEATVTVEVEPEKEVVHDAETSN